MVVHANLCLVETYMQHGMLFATLVTLTEATSAANAPLYLEVQERSDSTLRVASDFDDDRRPFPDGE